MLEGLVGGDHDGDMAGACGAIGSDGLCAFPGRPGDEVAIEGLRREVVEIGEPGRAVLAGDLDRIADAHHDDDGAVHGEGIPADPGGQGEESLPPGGVVARPDEHRDPTVADPRGAPDGGLRAARQPDGDRSGLGLESISQIGSAGGRPGAPHGCQPLVEHASPVLEAGAGGPVLAGMGANAETEDHPAPAQLLERGDLASHGRRVAQGELEDAGADRGRVRRGGGDGERDQRLEQRLVPEEMVTRPQGGCAGPFCGRRDLPKGLGST